MPIAKATLYNILSNPEMGLYEASRRDGIKELTAAQLKKKIERARKLRDKYKDMYRRQTIALRKNSTQGRVQGNKRTEQKQEVFADILSRFEARLKQVEKEEKAAAKKSTAKKTAKKPVKPAKKATKKQIKKKEPAKVILPPVPHHDHTTHTHGTYVPPEGHHTETHLTDSGFMNKQVENAVKTQDIHKSHTTAIEGHLSSRNKRFQGRKDNKG